jgi:hypothetical protein
MCEVYCKSEIIIICQQSTEIVEKLMQDWIRETNCGEVNAGLDQRNKSVMVFLD